jgi:hypothetical protein
MSEQNILNPSATSLLNFEYGYGEAAPELRTSVQATSGKTFTRIQMGQGRAYDLLWSRRDLATKHTLQQWAKQYENDFFTLADWERGRYFTGRFDGPLSFSPSGNAAYNIRGRFVELPGLAMFAYPTNWARDAVFIEERNGFGEDLVKLLTPSNWTYQVDANAHGGGHYYSAAPSGLETAEWFYFGYSCRVYSELGSDRGKAEFTITRVRDGAVVGGPTIVDLYSGPLVPSAVVLTFSNLPLDFYRFKLRVTNTKNVSSSAVICTADALEVMQ